VIEVKINENHDSSKGFNSIYPTVDSSFDPPSSSITAEGSCLRHMIADGVEQPPLAI
jgi:hypothetical protein